MRVNIALGLLLAALSAVGAQAQPVGSIPWGAIGPGLNICGGNQLCTSGSDSTKTANYTLAAGDMGGQVNFNGTGLTVTIPAISSTVLAQGMSVTIANQGTGTLTVTSTPTINGCAVTGSIPAGGFVSLVSNGTTLDATCSAPIATTSVFGTVKPDGTTVTVSGGVISAPGGGGGGSSTPAIPQGRLTLSSTNAVMTADVVNTSTVYYACYAGNHVPYFDGTTDQSGLIGGCSLSMTMPTSGTGVTNAAGVFDIFYTGSAICVATNGSGGGWASDTSGTNTVRGTGYSAVHNTRGYWTNTNSITNCYTGSTPTTLAADRGTYLGTLYTTGAGTTSMQFNPTPVAGGSNNMLGLYNAYNRVPTASILVDVVATPYNYTSTTIRATNNSTLDRISYVDGLAQTTAEANVAMLLNNGTSGYNVYSGCTSTTTATGSQAYTSIAGFQRPSTTSYCPPTGAGLRFVQLVEAASTAGQGPTVYQLHLNISLSM